VPADAIWDALTAGGGTLALSFIVLMALGLLALTAFYLGSAVVVLERFARTARSWRWVVVFGLATSALAAVTAVRLSLPEAGELSWSEWGHAFLPAATRALVLGAFAIALIWGALRGLRPALLARACLVLLGVACALWVGAAGVPLYAATPPALVALLAAALAWRRRRASRTASPPGDLERQLRWLSAALALGIPLSLGVSEPEPAIAQAGSVLVAVFFALVVMGLLPLAGAGLVGMRRSVEWFIAVRYLVAKRRQVFISAITGICVVGIAAGVWLIVIVLSVMNGFEKTWRDEIVGNRAHFTVHNSFGSFGDYEKVVDTVRSVPGVVGASPFLDAEGMVRGEGGEIHAVRVRGIDPRTVGQVTDLPSDIVMGSLDDLDAGHSQNGSAPRDPGIVIGNYLAVALNVSVGDELLLISPYGGPPTPLGPAPRLKRFRVVGVFESSFFQYDEAYTYVSLEAAQEFRHAGHVADGVDARTTDFYRSRQVAEVVRARLDYPFFTRDWKEVFPAFFQALKTERIMMFILLTMIMVVAAFVIVATLIMMIMEKSGDIAILKTMGAEDSVIERVFAIEGTLIGLAGTVLGVIAGLAVTNQLAWIQDKVERLTGIDTLPASVYQFSTLPSQIDPVQVGVVATIAMVLSLGATLLPSRQGAKLDPAEALRYE
jgi:lipoprotein-releasing system permease protein